MSSTRNFITASCTNCTSLNCLHPGLRGYFALDAVNLLLVTANPHIVAWWLSYACSLLESRVPIAFNSLGN